MGMRLFKGKFYDGPSEVPIPLQHGNKDQFQLLEKVRALSEPDGILITQLLDGNKYAYTCVCGNYIVRHQNDPYQFTCSECELKYSIYLDKLYGYLGIKLKK